MNSTTLEQANSKSTVQSPLPGDRHQVTEVRLIEVSVPHEVIDLLEEREGWTHERAIAVELEFRRFISLKQATNQAIAPSPLVDTLWHQLILSTRAYQYWCEMALGHFLHHDPLQVGEDTGMLAANRTLELLNHYFPEHDRDIWSFMHGDCRASSCSTSCNA